MIMVASIRDVAIAAHNNMRLRKFDSLFVQFSQMRGIQRSPFTNICFAINRSLSRLQRIMCFVTLLNSRLSVLGVYFQLQAPHKKTFKPNCSSKFVRSSSESDPIATPLRYPS